MSARRAAALLLAFIMGALTTLAVAVGMAGLDRPRPATTGWRSTVVLIDGDQVVQRLTDGHGRSYIVVTNDVGVALTSEVAVPNEAAEEADER